MSLPYRPDIDGLRAIAILAVVFFHAGVPHAGGGYVGVDIFFVISGYLIAGNIRADLAAGRFTLSGFYEKRIRRLLPALAVMLAVVTLAACIVLLPQPLRHYGSSLTAAALLGANFYFHGKTGYFDAPAADKPLLHLWSLGVEEQFYLLFPALMLLLLWLARRWKAFTPAALPWALLGLASLAAACALVNYPGGQPETAFYLMPFRLWQFMLGILLALYPPPRPRAAGVASALAFGGLALILAPIMLYTPATAFPGLAALPPTLGAALLIWSGSGPATLPHRLLSWRPAVFVGLVSYAFYLWHWPLLVLPQMYKTMPLTAAETTLWMLLAFLLAALSWKYVETPVRTRKILKTRKAAYLALAVAVLMFALAGVALKVTRGWPQRLPEQVLRLDAERLSQNPRQAECFKMNERRDARAITPQTACAYGAAGVTPTVALWGDSHADALIAPLGELAERKGAAVAFFGMTGCLPLPPLPEEQPATACDAFNRQALETILASPHLETVILMGRHGGYVLDAPPAAAAHAPGGTRPPFNNPQGTLATQRERVEYWNTRLQTLVNLLLKQGRKVAVVYPVPEPGRDTPAVLAGLALRGQNPASFAIPRPAHEARHAPLHEKLENLSDAAAPGNLIRVRPAQALCDAQSCATYAEGHALYYDDHHLSLHGGRAVTSLMQTLF